MIYASLPEGKFGAIYADPPWHFTRYSENSTASKGRAPQDHYDTMNDGAIMSLPVSSMAADNCVLFMWAVYPKLDVALEVLKAWDFTYKTVAFTWVKANASQIDMFRDDIRPSMLMGYWTRSNAEVCLLATRGFPKRLNADVLQAIIEPKREHSRKPDCVYGRIERLVAGPYLELFARTQRQGWTAWGNQTDKFKATA